MFNSSRLKKVYGIRLLYFLFRFSSNLLVLLGEFFHQFSLLHFFLLLGHLNLIDLQFGGRFLHLIVSPVQYLHNHLFLDLVAHRVLHLVDLTFLLAYLYNLHVWTWIVSQSSPLLL